MLQRFVLVVMLAVLLYCPLSVWAEAGNVPVEMNIQVGPHLLTATLVGNSTTAALIELLQEGPITINMHDYASMEKVGALPTSLPRNDESINTEAGDLILYQGNQFVIYYDTNSWSLTRIGKINDMTQQALKDILGSGDVTAILSVGETANAETSQTPTEADDFVFIEAGAFRMGSPDEEPEREADESLHDVTVASFYIAPHEVTQAEYTAVTGNNPSFHQGEDLPVESITWYGAIQYCNALSLEAGLTPCYTLDGDTVTWDRTANGYRLPTEAEWEYACRAGTATPFHFGDDVQDSDTNCYNAYGYNNDASGQWVHGYLQHTTAVQSYGANSLGLYDMHGNVCEWVWDWYDIYDEAPAENPTGPDAGHYKVARGGGWNEFPKHIRSAYRSAFPADVPLYSIGIRPARNADALDGSITSIGLTQPEMAEGKVLIAYFSQTGNTEGLANIIAGMTGAGIFRIEREAPYSATHNAQSLYAEALTECRDNAVPGLSQYLEDAGLDISQYDTILLGYCNWWATIPAPVRSFLDRYDLSGKTIIPFCSQGGGRFGQTISAIAKLAPDSSIREGLWVTYSSYPETEILDWLTRSGIDVVR